MVIYMNSFLSYSYKYLLLASHPKNTSFELWLASFLFLASLRSGQGMEEQRVRTKAIWGKNQRLEIWPRVSNLLSILENS